MSSENAPSHRLVTAIVIGCGQRGQNYAAIALDFPERLQIVGIAEPLKHRRERMAEDYKLAADRTFADWTEFLSIDKVADIAIICTQDKDHCLPAVAMAKKGYHILVEKPMAVTEEDCIKITKACEENHVMLAVCHVLRYYPPVVKIKEVIDSGIIGDVMTINHTENVGYWHFAHSFVRGNWRNEAESTFSLMAKCCHDVDLLTYWLSGRKAISVQSFGSLQHFKKENQPQEATDRCLSCPLAQTCPYSAVKIYLNNPVKSWPMSVVCDIEDDPTKYPQALKKTLETSRYGQCVYKCDNDVCDSQVVNVLFEGGTVANLTMTAFSSEICQRYTRVTGSKGELTWNGSSYEPIKVHTFSDNQITDVYPDLEAPVCRTRGHGGADYFLMDSILKAVANGDEKCIKSGAKESLESHLLVFRAETSRRQNVVA